jgi:hypothetical protein
MKHPDVLFEFSPGMEILIDRRYTSVVVGITEDKSEDTPVNLIVFKDWNPDKKIWDYHVMREYQLSYLMDLYEREFLDDMKCPMTKKERKIKEKHAVAGYDKKKPVLDYDYLKDMFSKYKRKNV